MTSSNPSDAAVAPAQTNAGWWALVAFAGHAPGLFVVGKALAAMGKRAGPPRMGRRTVRLNLLVLGATLVATGAFAAADAWWFALGAFGVGHFGWSFLLAARIWSGAVAR